MSKKRITVLVFSLVLMLIVVAYSVGVIITPKWSFSVAIGKSSYVLGEDVKITVSLKNLVFITHSFKSALGDLMVVSIEYQYTEKPHSDLSSMV